MNDGAMQLNTSIGQFSVPVELSTSPRRRQRSFKAEWQAPVKHMFIRDVLLTSRHLRYQIRCLLGAFAMDGFERGIWTFTVSDGDGKEKEVVNLNYQQTEQFGERHEARFHWDEFEQTLMMDWQG